MKSYDGINDGKNSLETKTCTWLYASYDEKTDSVYYIDDKWMTEADLPIKQWAIDEIKQQPFF